MWRHRKALFTLIVAGRASEDMVSEVVAPGQYQRQGSRDCLSSVWSAMSLRNAVFNRIKWYTISCITTILGKTGTYIDEKEIDEDKCKENVSWQRLEKPIIGNEH